MFEQIEWVRCDEKMPDPPRMGVSVAYLVTLEIGRTGKVYVDIYNFCHVESRGKPVVRWEAFGGTNFTSNVIAWAKMPTGWRDGNDG